MKQMEFYQKPTCSTCRKAKKWLAENGVKPKEFDLNQGLSEAELDALIGPRDYAKFLNFRNELYREKKMKVNPPSRAEAIRLMAQHPNLIRRPMLVRGSKIVLGFDEEEYRTMTGIQK
jgi:Spx/MgsR family transcriptional regulator